MILSVVTGGREDLVSRSLWLVVVIVDSRK